ncbi:unnamed protein product, partial [Lymnaea stagnalis]
MAERGVYGDLEDNPFSFKTFVGVKEKKVSKNSSDLTFLDTDDIFGVNDKKNEKLTTDKIDIGVNIETIGVNNDFLDEINQAVNEAIPSSVSLASRTNVTSSGKKAQPKDNPFSFKKFLSSSSNPSKAKKGNAEPSPQAFEISNGSALSDQRSHHMHISTQSKPSVTLQKTNDESSEETVQPIADDALASDVARDLAAGSIDLNHFASEPFSSSASNRLEQLSRSDNDNECDVTVGAHKRKQSLPLALPDFLADGAALQVYQSPFDLPGKVKVEENYDDLLEKITKLQEENSRLKVELNRERQLCSDKNQRLLQLNIDLERQKKKELEETAVLERAVQQVEETLVTTTKRAVQAEVHVSMLKKEVKLL